MSDENLAPGEAPKRPKGFQKGHKKHGGRRVGTPNKYTLTRRLEEGASDLFTVLPEVTGSPREVMDQIMRFFAGIGQKFLQEAQRLDESGDRAGALDSYHRSERATALAMESAKAVAPYVHPRLSEAHDAAPSEVMIKGGLLAADAPADELPLFRLAPANQLAPPPVERPTIDLEASPVESDKPGPKRWKVEI
jgi:hypothetical protein